MSSPLQNRVTPWGEIRAIAARGTFMGNRGGRLHGPDRTLGRRRWVSQRWICCTLAFRGRRRAVMGTGYTELFFLDEVTALAAGHRPCFECRRAAARAFAACVPLPAPASARVIDRALHADRLGARPMIRAAALVDGTMFELDGQAWAVRAGRSLRWTPEGYDRVAALPDGTVRVLTPALSRAALAAGYEPTWHPSAVTPIP